ncbi:hypothetical protein AAHB56_01215, partial [Bacillus thuringiensis]
YFVRPSNCLAAGEQTKLRVFAFIVKRFRAFSCAASPTRVTCFRILSCGSFRVFRAPLQTIVFSD